MLTEIKNIDKSHYIHKIFIIFLSISLYPLSLLINLSFKNNLISQNKIIDFNVSVQSEMNNGRKFWWLTEDKTYLSFINKAPYDVNANLILKIEENPCGKISNFSIKNKSRELYNNLAQDTLNLKFLSINLPIQIKRFETISLEIEPIDNVDCKVDNGDTRKFLAKITEFRIELN
jgi:hypothetical protein